MPSPWFSQTGIFPTSACCIEKVEQGIRPQKVGVKPVRLRHPRRTE
jgi:hypothetical protein